MLVMIPLVGEIHICYDRNLGWQCTWSSWREITDRKERYETARKAFIRRLSSPPSG